MQIELTVSPTPSDPKSYPSQKMVGRFGQERGEMLSRLAVGLRAENPSPDDDEKLILKAVADALLAGE
jgi:hypothetical protein